MKGQLADNEHRFVEFCSEGENIKDELGYFFVLQGQGTAIVHEELYIKDKFITPSSGECKVPHALDPLRGAVFCNTCTRTVTLLYTALLIFDWAFQQTICSITE